MKLLRLLGLYRERIFSPGKIEDDAAIMDATMEALSSRGWDVHALPAEAISPDGPRPENVLSMAQSEQALGILEEWSSQGTRVINTVSSVRNCNRKTLTHLLLKAGICIPPSRMITLAGAKEKISLECSNKLWLKRGDVHAIEPGDVASVTCREELAAALKHFRGRDIREILIQEHVKGPVVKFYAVGQNQDAYFKAFLVSKGKELTSQVEQLWSVARQAAGAVGLEVYGGDAVLTEENGAVLIDLNAWPSFSRCCYSAATGIATYVQAKLERNEGL
jgi:glutathione synthase/RimK-type ligase-like ATP-grasp enzyme